MIEAQPATEERNWAMAAHLSALIAIIGFPFGHIVGPLIVYLAKGTASPFVGQHSKASLNYQITLSIGAFVALALVVLVFFLLILLGVMSGAGHETHGEAGGASIGAGILGLWISIFAVVAACAVASIVFIIMGSVAAAEGRPYTYPFAIRFFR